MTSVERIVEYTNIEGENLKKREIKNDKNWPNVGKIEFKNVSFAYEDQSDKNILEDLNLIIDSNKRTAIIGRTGVGKSTIFQALYRISEPIGDILIDNVNIKDVSLYDLRSKLSIIPVSNFLFT
jgi:ABC-type multidrug transport system fused ATPase/permease subunit